MNIIIIQLRSLELMKVIYSHYLRANKTGGRVLERIRRYIIVL